MEPRNDVPTTPQDLIAAGELNPDLSLNYQLPPFPLPVYNGVVSTYGLHFEVRGDESPLHSYPHRLSDFN